MMADPMNTAGALDGSRPTLGTKNQKTEGDLRMSHDTLDELRYEHAAREIKRLKLRLPIIVATVGVAAICLLPGVVLLLKDGNPAAFIVSAAVAVAASVLWNMSAQLLAEWDRAVVLRMGRFERVAGPGFFMIVPVVQHVSRVLDTRIRTTSFYVESMLTKDTVPISIEAIAFWRILDAQKAVLEVEDYYQAITMAVQTAHRDIIGEHNLTDILAKREEIVRELKNVLEAKANTWGIDVGSIEIRDITIPQNLQQALSKQAQAERERLAREILGEAEMDIADKFAKAAEGYRDNPIALQLRSMNIIYEGLRSGTSMMLVPSSVLDTMNLGSMVALGESHRPKAVEQQPE